MKIHPLNQNGQSLVLFILVLPLLLMIGTFVIDIAYISNEKLKLDNINKLVISTYLDRSSLTKEELILLTKENDDEIENIYMDIEENICITLEKKVSSLLGGIFGYQSYDISSRYCGTKNPSKKIYQSSGKE